MSLDGYTHVIDLLPEATLLVGGSGLILAANPAALDQLGVASSALTGQQLCDVVVKPAQVAAYLRACARSKQRVIGSLDLAVGAQRRCRVEGVVLRPRAGAEEAVVLLRILPKEGSIGRFLLLNHQIDELNREIARRKRVEDELRAQREWLQVTLRSIGDAVITTDMNGDVTFLNPRAEVLTGWTQAEASGKPLKIVFSIINEYTREPVENPVAQVLARGEVVGLANHTVLIARDGTENAIEDTAAPIRESGGDLRGVVLVFHDVGDRRVLERQLMERAQKLSEADRRKDEFLAMLAHELRNPLAPLRNSLHLLRTKPDEPRLVEQVGQIMDRQVEHLTRMVDDLLDVSRITQGKITLRPERLDLARLARLAAEDRRPQIEAAGLMLAVELPGAPVWVWGDPTRLAQILGNLLENAAKFSERGGAIALRLAGRPGGAAELVIRDEGIGIEPDLLPSIFEPFAQADRTLDRSRGGLGLGLAMVKGLVELHGGSVDARSEGSGRGAEIAVRLPLLEGTQAPEEASVDAPPARSDLRILVVEDNRDAAETLQMVLEFSGYAVVVAYNGPDALAAARQARPDVVLCDIGLPGMDGFAVATALRSEPRTACVRLIAVTGYGEESMRKRVFDAGFDAHLVKPIDLQELALLLADEREA